MKTLEELHKEWMHDPVYKELYLKAEKKLIPYEERIKNLLKKLAENKNDN